MKKLQYILSLLNLLPLLAFSQSQDCDISINGKVLDIETKEPLPYVTVKVEGTDDFTLTDENGEFVIEGLCSEENTLIISCFGYCDSVCEDHHQHGKQPHFYLTHKVEELESIVIKAQNNSKEGTESISQVTVKREELKLDPTRSLADVISGQQGVTFISTGSNIKLPVIHGLYGNRILVLNNGLKHGFQNWGTDHAPEIDVSAADNITIVKGAAGVKYGPEALGGAIIVHPNPLYLNEPTRAKIGTGYQTNGRGYFTNAEVTGGYDKWSYFVNGNYTKIGDRHAPDYMLTNTGKEEKSFGLGTRLHLDKWDFKVYYSYIDQDLGILRASISDNGQSLIDAINADKPTENYTKPFSYNIDKPNQLITHHFGKAEASWLYSDEGKLTFRLGQQFNNRQEFDVRRDSDAPIIDLDLVTADYQLEWKHPDWWKLDGVIGVQYFDQYNSNNPGTGVTAFIPNYNINRFSAFVNESLRKRNNLFEIGLRYDYEYSNIRTLENRRIPFRDEYVFSNFTASLGYVRDISKNTTFRTNLGTAWRSPNMAELYSFGQHGSKLSYGLLRYSFDENGNISTDKIIPMDESDVEAERGYKFTNEFQTSIGKSVHTATIYANYIQNFIYDRPYGLTTTIRGPMPAFIYVQADAVFVGLDYNWKMNWTKKLEGTYGLSYLWSRNVSDNEPLINQPPIRTSYALDWKHKKFWKFDTSSFMLKGSYTFEQFDAPQTIPPEDIRDGTVVITPETEIFDFKDAPDGYFLLDASWRFTYKNFGGSLTVENILDTSYRDYLDDMRYFADEPGRNFLISLNYTFK